ncbi:MAG: hypothetical protein COV41_03005 [Candidatus Brennerbacteria bacterium CG11_big_fil_rev_8_21_14_0_20_43_10]|uniref:Nucleotidyl transferase AbiEii/AbiGii toxin family protein n=3 Tax=Candidatus Brenneribacteriota TaxID=1817902 RepID=A0A2H9N3P0_9BACT|nr:MAG: hypothetical protein AUJ43_02715 [Parcubacteria group bacterium CG1_02_44_31]PIP50470.1 MAG: hypothetical protein COX12_01135 [Candidatus Brennerbacteria bacterium CG23_combo_of_CG06-09_8_20_14_all_44_41]PIR25360.1 MAG: hypothetical protein COV41_03005 [Candidatus Brennerbacteria bacterium CG11_big_fil_rev_8_21_14_0_20_43_10]PIX28515.1 MAG: hypothetical protein COZ64_02895 [Candidatus Brennerbacteria bacterium CG_4_8_14_3_um_filter_43_14]PJA19681.1 MAG: hypothetical protein COX61_00505 
MAKTILTIHQDRFLKLFSDSSLSKTFYFTGGTALAHFYLRHRYSEDLDFFCEKEFHAQTISVFLKSTQKKLRFLSVDFQKTFNRNLYHIKFPKGVLKVEFTYFPFSQIQKPKAQSGILVDSLVDIAANKLFTINQNPRGRDYYDLYYIFQKKHFRFEQLRQLAKIKFDWHIDPLQLGSQLNRVEEFLDDPILTQRIPNRKISAFFHAQAQMLKSQILKA